MNNDEIKSIFDQQASTYDERWANTAPIRDGLHLLLGAGFARLPENARILCIGSGTGSEIDYLAKRFTQWTFTAVEPSGEMLKVFRSKAELGGYYDRCRLHEGYLDSLPDVAEYDGATCFLVSQFMLDEQARTEFFRSILMHLKKGGILASSDLSSAQGSSVYETLLQVWFDMMAASGIPSSGIEQMRSAYANDVAVSSANRIEQLLQAAGFYNPVKFYQAGLIQAWLSTKI
jgi:tRNA (cmo5U34)-methyltransferase